MELRSRSLRRLGFGIDIISRTSLVQTIASCYRQLAFIVCRADHLRKYRKQYRFDLKEYKKSRLKVIFRQLLAFSGIILKKIEQKACHQQEFVLNWFLLLRKDSEEAKRGGL